MDNLSFEQKIVALALANTPKEKKELIDKFSNNAEFFATINARTMPFEQYMKMHYEEFKPIIAEATRMRAQVNNKGWTEKKYQKYMGELPQRMLNERPEFSAFLPRKVFSANVRRFFDLYPEFRVDK